MQTISEIRRLLDERGLRPRKALGQNFLHDQNQIRRLLEAAALEPGDLVLEVGPGTGTLTEALLDRGCRVIAAELDAELAGLLTERLGDRITLIEGDAMGRRRTLAPAIVAALDGEPFRLVANLPYQIATPLMVTLALDHPTCRGQYVTIQREVADRLEAVPGTKAWGVAGILVRLAAVVRRIGTLPPSCFWPMPQVTSAMVAIEPRPEEAWLVSRSETAVFASWVSGVFSRRRKQLGSILGREIAWPDGVEPAHRPETLSLEQLVELWRRLGHPDAP